MSADRGMHEFTYAILPCRDDDMGQIVKYAHNLNRLPIIYNSQDSLESLVYISSDTLVCDTVKLSEDKKGRVVRVYEAIGQSVKASIEVSFKYDKVFECNLIENDRKAVDLSNLTFGPC